MKLFCAEQHWVGDSQYLRFFFIQSHDSCGTSHQKFSFTIFRIIFHFSSWVISARYFLKLIVWKFTWNFFISKINYFAITYYDLWFPVKVLFLTFFCTFLVVLWERFAGLIHLKVNFWWFRREYFYECGIEKGIC